MDKKIFDQNILVNQILDEKKCQKFFGPKTFDPEKCCSLKKNCSKIFFGPNMFWYNVEKGSKNCLERVKLRVSEVSDPPRKL